MDAVAPELAGLPGHRVVHGQPGSVATTVARGISTAASSAVLYPLAALTGGLLGIRTGRVRLLDALAGPLALAAGSAARIALSVLLGRSRPPTADWLSSAMDLSCEGEAHLFADADHYNGWDRAF